MSGLSFAVFTLLSAIPALAAQPLNGRWDGVIHYNDNAFTFPIEFATNGSQVSASFFNGDERVTSTSGTLDGNKLTIRFDHYATVLDATLTDGMLKGTYGGKRNGYHDIEARLHQEIAASAEKGPDIAGIWDIITESPKGEHAWRLIVRQKNTDVSAAILRIDGDTGAIVGSYQGGKFVLNHFDGSRAYLLEMTPQQNGSLALALTSGKAPPKNYIAVRQTEARAKGLPEPTNPEEHTRVKNPHEPFQFSFPDLDGKLVSNTDARFKDKVVLVNITGSWCPNCHDEAPFLAELYRRYRALGLEIVALDFEEPEQLADKSRVRAFIKKYGIEYTYLIAGEPKELEAKVPQGENLNSWPTTFFLGRDGKVRAVHAGFAAIATGEFNAQLKRGVTETVERLLAERVEATTARAQQ